MADDPRLLEVAVQLEADWGSQDQGTSDDEASLDRAWVALWVGDVERAGQLTADLSSTTDNFERAIFVLELALLRGRWEDATAAMADVLTDMTPGSVCSASTTAR